MKDLIKTLRSMAKRPAFYFGRRPATLGHLESFFLGLQVGAKMGEDLKAFDAFEEWVLWRHGAPKLSTNSFGYILHHAAGDESRAFGLFFEYLEEFLLEREKIGAKGIRAGLKSYYDSTIPSIADIKSDSFYEAYVNTLKKIFAEFLGWSEDRTLSYVEQQLQNKGFRRSLELKTPFSDASFLLIPESLRDRLRGFDLIQLQDKIWKVLDGSGDPRYDWQKAKRKVARLLKKHAVHSEQKPSTSDRPRNKNA